MITTDEQIGEFGLGRFKAQISIISEILQDDWVDSVSFDRQYCEKTSQPRPCVVRGGGHISITIIPEHTYLLYTLEQLNFIEIMEDGSEIYYKRKKK